MCLIVYANVVGMLLIVSGNVELNPGPFKKCSKCETFVATCKCGHVFLKYKWHNVVESKRTAMRMKRVCENEIETVERKMLNISCLCLENEHLKLKRKHCVEERQIN